MGGVRGDSGIKNSASFVTMPDLMALGFLFLLFPILRIDLV